MADVVEVCPKCGCPVDRRPGRDQACVRCGLLRARFAGYHAQIAAHPVLDPMWSAAQADWDSARPHEALMAIAATDWTLLSAVSQRYSAVLRQRPDDLSAKRAMDRLIEVATGLPLPSNRGKAGEGARLAQVAQVSKLLVGVGLLVLTVILTLSVLRR